MPDFKPYPCLFPTRILHLSLQHRSLHKNELVPTIQGCMQSEAIF